MIVIADGNLTTIYNESIDLSALTSELGGEMSHHRASHVEPDGAGWKVDLSPVGGPAMGGFSLRSDALEAESKWLNNNLERLSRS